MEDLEITSWFKIQEYDDEIGLEYKIKGAGPLLYVHSLEQAEKLHTWLTQWLKENPVKVERWVGIYDDDTVVLFENQGQAEIARDCTSEMTACIPISYHIGQGLETAEEET